MRIALCALVALLVGCSAQRPSMDLGASRFAGREGGPAPSDRTHVLGQGSSPDGLEAARARARADVCNQIRSTVRSSLSVEGTLDGDRILETISQNCAFAHGELIRDLGGACERGLCSATAGLDRSSASSVLSDEYRRAAPEFRTAAAQAALASVDPVEFTVLLRRAEQVFTETLAPLALELRVIGGGLPEAAQDDHAFRELQTLRGRRLGGVRLVIATDALEASRREALSGALVAAFGALGVSAALGSSCTDGLLFRPASRTHCERGFFGPECTVSVEGDLARCGGAPLTALTARLTGAHTRDEALALKSALDSARDSLKDPLRVQVRGILPVP